MRSTGPFAFFALLLSFGCSHSPGASTDAGHDAASEAQDGAADSVQDSTGSPDSPDSAPGWTQLTNTNYQNVCPPDGFTGANYAYTGQLLFTGCFRVITSWSSGTVDTKRNRLLFMGDGHDGYDDNAVYALDMSTRSGSVATSCGSFTNCSTNATAPTLTRLNDPSAGGSGSPTCPATEPPDGAPTARQTYNALIYLPKADALWNYGTSDRCVDPFGTVGYGYPYLLAFNPDGSPNGWTKKPTSGPSDSGAGSECVLDSLWTGTGDAVICLLPNHSVWRYRLDDDSWTSIGSGLGTRNGTTLVLDPERRLIFSVGPNYDGYGPAIWAINYDDPNTATDWTPTVTGCTDWLAYPYPSAVYDPGLKRIVGYVPQTAAAPKVAANRVVIFDPATKTCVAQPQFDGAVPAAHPSIFTQGMFGRFNYIPGVGKYVLINNNTTDAYSLSL